MAMWVSKDVNQKPLFCGALPTLCLNALYMDTYLYTTSFWRDVSISDVQMFGLFTVYYLCKMCLFCILETLFSDFFIFFPVTRERWVWTPLWICIADVLWRLCHRYICIFYAVQLMIFSVLLSHGLKMPIPSKSWGYFTNVNPIRLLIRWNLICIFIFLNVGIMIFLVCGTWGRKLKVSLICTTLYQYCLHLNFNDTLNYGKPVL